MSFLHYDIWFLWCRLHSVVTQPPVYDKTQYHAYASAISQLEGSQTIVHSIAIYINEMTTAKGRFIVLFLLGLSQYSAH